MDETGLTARAKCICRQEIREEREEREGVRVYIDL